MHKHCPRRFIEDNCAHWNICLYVYMYMCVSTRFSIYDSRYTTGDFGIPGPVGPGPTWAQGPLGNNIR